MPIYVIKIATISLWFDGRPQSDDEGLAMLYVLGLNFKIGLKFIWRFLIIVLITALANGSPKAVMLIWPVKIFVVFLILGWWFRKMKKESGFRYFEASFLCTGVYWIQTTVLIAAKHEIGGGWMVYMAMFLIAGMIIAAKTQSDSWKIIQKYYPHLKEYTEIVWPWHSPDDCFERFSNAENLERELTEIEKEACPAVVRAIGQRKAGGLVIPFHLEIIYLTLLILCCSPWMK